MCPGTQSAEKKPDPPWHPLAVYGFSVKGHDPPGPTKHTNTYKRTPIPNAIPNAHLLLGRLLFFDVFYQLKTSYRKHPAGSESLLCCRPDGPDHPCMQYTICDTYDPMLDSNARMYNMDGMMGATSRGNTTSGRTLRRASDVRFRSGSMRMPGHIQLKDFLGNIVPKNNPSPNIVTLGETSRGNMFDGKHDRWVGQNHRIEDP